MKDGRRLTPYSKGIVTDTKNALQWVTFAIGQKPSQQGASGDANLYSWKQLKLVIQKINGGKGYAGFHDWRIPSTSELEGVINADGEGQVFALDDPLEYWTADAETETTAYLYGRELDGLVIHPKDYRAAIRLVRTLTTDQLQEIQENGLLVPELESTKSIASKLVEGADEVLKSSQKVASSLREKGIEKIKEAGFEQQAIQASEKISQLKPVLQKKVDKVSAFIKAEQDGDAIAAGSPDYSGVFGVNDKMTRNIVLLYVAMVFLSGFLFVYVGGILVYIISLWLGDNPYTFFSAIFPFFDSSYYVKSFYCTLYLSPAILIGSIFSWFKNPSGKSIAKAFKGKELFSGEIKNEKLKKLDCMVDELAKKSGIKKPAIFVINEKSLNAFAAGKSQDDAVIGVTSGLLKRLNDEEVKAVVAHEFGHILNKDVRLNMFAMSAVFGFKAIFIYAAGIWFARSLVTDGTAQSKALWSLVFGAVAAAILATGALMAFCGTLMQKAISRHREYLADSSSVQLTGSADGLISAFEKIKNNEYPTEIESKMALQYSHAMIFGTKFASLFDTHPPIEERIERLKAQASSV